MVIKMTVREASYGQADVIFELYEQCRTAFRGALVDKWSDGRPDFDDVFGYIDDGICYVVEDDGKVVAAFILDFSGETAYRIPLGCQWPVGEYGVLHRVAVDKNSDYNSVVESIVDFCISRCAENGVEVIRSGSHPKDQTLCNALSQCGFEPCGRFRTTTGEERHAYYKGNIQ